jgi:transposase
MKAIEPTLQHGSLNDLRAILKQIKDVQVYRRLEAIVFRMEGHSIIETCHQMQISRDTLNTWVRRWNEGGLSRLSEGQRTGRPRKLPPDIKNLVIQEIEGRLPDGTPYKALWLHGHLKKKDRT